MVDWLLRPVSCGLRVSLDLPGGVKVKTKEENSVTAEKGKDTSGLLNLQYSEFQHLQNMARGLLSITIAAGAVSIAALSEFYFPVPSIKTEVGAYRELALPFGISPEVGLLTVSFSLLTAMILIVISANSFAISFANYLELLVPKASKVSGAEESILNAPSKAIDSNQTQLSKNWRRYRRATIRLLFGILFAFLSFMIYNFMVSQEIFGLLVLHVFFLLPTPIVDRFLESLLPKAIPDSDSQEGSGESTDTIYEELLKEEGKRFEAVEFRDYEKLILTVSGFVSLLVIISWIGSISLKYLS